MRDERVEGGRGERNPGRDENASAGLVLQAIVKAARAFVIYLPNNPLHGKFFEDLRARLDEHLEGYGALRLTVEHDVFRRDGQVVYTSPELRENLAFRLYADGIRALSFEEGLEPRELRTFVEIVSRPAGEEEDDVVTRLWSADLPHVLYVLADLPAPEDPSALGVTAPATTQAEAVRRAASSLGQAAAVPLAAPVEPALPILTITEAETTDLLRRVAEEEARPPFEDVTAILEAILAGEGEDALFEELTGLVARLSGDLLLTGGPERALELVELLNRTASLPGLAAARSRAIEAARAQVVREESLPALAKVLGRPDGIARDTLHALVTGLGRAAVGPFCRVLGEVESKESRKVLLEALAKTAREAPELLLPSLGDERWYLVRNTIYILRRIGSPESTGAVLRCLGHRDPRVRKEVLLYFDEVADPAGDAVAIRLLEDELPALRIAAMRSLARRRTRVGPERLLALVCQERFAERDLEERQAAWESLAELDPAGTLPRLRELLLRRRLFGQARELDDVACAAGALRRLGSPEAIALLREAAGRKRGRALELVEEALRSAARSGAGRAPEEGRRG